MKVLKFGGSSIADINCISGVCEIINNELKKADIAIVLSAIYGVTNLLCDSIDKAVKKDNIQQAVDAFHSKHKAVIEGLFQAKADLQVSLDKYLNKICDQYKILLQGVSLLGECPDKIYCQILSLGERMSAQIMLNLLNFSGVDVTFLDAVEFIKTKGSLKESIPVMEELVKRLQPVKNKHCLLMSGFIGSDSQQNHLSLLGRDGADYSASLMAAALGASVCEIWTDVDGIYTADPRQVSDARLISRMSYGEAMELAFYGAKILHPKTTAVLMEAGIPLYIKNSFKPSQKGTEISQPLQQTEKSLISAVSCRKHVTLINISGSGMKGSPGIAARVFDAVAKCGASIILITQASSECSICFCIASKDTDLVMRALSDALALELKSKIIEKMTAFRDQAIVCVVGDNMKQRIGVAGKVFSALSHSAISVVAIAQGASEQSISVVIDGKQSSRAVHAVHRSFFHTLQPIDLYLVGVGSVGSELVEQIKSQAKELLDNQVDVRLCLIANSRKYLHSTDGLDLNNWRDNLENSEENMDIQKVINQAATDKSLNGILVDCTSSEVIADRYVDAFNAGLHVVAANKKANSDRLDYYKALRAEADKGKRLFLYETNVGAGLPTIDAFKYLIKSGDKLLHFSGILSGSLSFIFGALDEGMLFSKAVKLACDKKFTEPDPRDDLNGMDVARKLLILARETGLNYELDDINIEAIFPDDFDASGSVADFLNNLEKVDSYFSDKIAALQSENKVLRLVGEITPSGCSVGIRAAGPDHPLYAIKNGENAFAFLTRRYSPIPLVVRGYGAGVEVTASGLFADILKTVDIN